MGTCEAECFVQRLTLSASAIRPPTRPPQPPSWNLADPGLMLCRTLPLQVMAAIGSNSERWGFFTVDLEFERREGSSEGGSGSSEADSTS